MRRVMALIGFSSFFVSLFCIYFKLEFTIALFSVALVGLIVVLLVKKIRLSILIVLLCTVMVSCLNCYVTDKQIEKYKVIYCYKETKISGKLLDYPEVSDSGFKYIFKTTDENKVKFSIMSNDMLDAKPGDIITGSFEFDDRYANPEDKIYFSAYTYSTSNIKVVSKNEFNIAKIRKALKQGIVDNTTYARGLTKAILFSDKSGLSDEVYSHLQRCGLLHATATSGLHLTIVTGFVFALMSFLGVSRKKSSIFAIVFIVLFMLVIGFRFSLMRAGIMMIIYFSANLFDRENDAFNAIGLSIAFLTLQNPYTTVSCSFLLSVSATIGMLIAFKYLNAKVNSLNFKRFVNMKKVFVAVSASVLQSASAIIFTLPVTYLFFGYFSIAGIVANAILSFFISAILILGLIICLTSFVPVIPIVLGDVLDVICQIVLKIIAKISEFKYCLVDIDFVYMAFAISFCFLAVSISVLVYYFAKFDKKCIVYNTILFCVNFMLASILLNAIFPTKTVDIKLQNSSNGLCVTAIYNDKMVVIDTGGKKALKRVNYEATSRCLEKIDAVIIPSNEKAFNSAKQVTNAYKTENVLYDYSKFKTDEKIFENSTDISNGGTIHFDEFSIEIYKQKLTDVFYLTNGKVSVLIIDENTVCASLPKYMKKCNMLVVSDTPPIDVYEIKAESATVCSYDLFDTLVMSVYCPTYPLNSQSVEVEMGKTLYSRVV
ncbi:MAG: ComEC/Rec2 family competence protein [Clostridia bacterium]|nr:ComEC/Rec2 family competence protein [Clostridia bacterium]